MSCHALQAERILALKDRLARHKFGDGNQRFPATFIASLSGLRVRENSEASRRIRGRFACDFPDTGRNSSDICFFEENAYAEKRRHTTLCAGGFRL